MINIKKFICFILIFVLMFNLTIKNVYASPIALPIGSYKLAKFIIACLAVGVGFNALEEAEKLMNEYSKKYSSPPEPDPGNDKDIIKKILLGLGALEIIDIATNLKIMLDGSVIGKNKYNYLELVDDMPDKFHTQQFKVDKTKVIHFRGYNVYFSIIDDGLTISTSVDSVDGVTGWKINKDRDPNVLVDYMEIRDDGRIYITGYMYTSIGGDYRSRFREYLRLPPTTEEIPSGHIEYVVIDENAKILTGENITEEDIKEININPEYIPNEKLERVLENGKLITIYNGSIDELIDDIVANTPYSQIVTNKEVKYIQKEDGKVEIIYDQVPEPEPEPEPGPDPGEYDIPENDINIDFSPLFNIGITEKFPFSLPWDVKRMVEMFRAEREAPVWQLPIQGEVITIDFNNFNEIARIARIMNLMIYIVGLVIVTRRFISGP